jgi:TolA-binding protein
MKLVLGIIAVIVIATAFSMIPLPDHPAVADQSAPQQQPIADVLQDFITERMAVDQRLRTLEQRLQTLEQHIQTLLETRERAAPTRTETAPKSSVTSKQATAKRHRRETSAGKTVDVGHFDCPPSLGNACQQRPAPVAAPKGTREYDEAGAEIK